MRTATISRHTKETEIALTLALDGRGSAEIAVGVGFFEHLMTLMTYQARFDLSLQCKGDLHVDGHHTLEDCGIALGEALLTALGDKRGITRYGQCLLPMDEALCEVALDLSGRAGLFYDVPVATRTIGDCEVACVLEFLKGLCRASGLCLHMHLKAGTDPHHALEAAFKGLGRALRQAVSMDAAFAEEIPSTKGQL